jgi:hypothetical protein
VHEPLFWLKMGFVGVWAGLSVFPTNKSLFLIFLCGPRLLSSIALIFVSNATHSYIHQTYLGKEKLGSGSTHDGKARFATQDCDHGRDHGHSLNSTRCDVHGPRRSLLGRLSFACRDCSCCPDNRRSILLVRETGSDLEGRRTISRRNGAVKEQNPLPMILDPELPIMLGCIMLNASACCALASYFHKAARILLSQ